jgi:class 3 adenylate cyclase/pimeloyl-ACP methyl ester carboxylesterase
VEVPETRYAMSGDLHIAYQIFGQEPPDLVLIPNWFTNVETSWDVPAFAAFFRGVASFARVIMLDPRGMGVSDAAPGGTVPTLEEWVEDIVAVLDAEQVDSAALVGLGPGVPIAVMMAASRPERTTSLVLVNGSAHRARGMTPESREQLIQMLVDGWGSDKWPMERLAPSSTEAERRVQYRQQRLIASPRQVSTMQRMMIETDLSGALSSIRVPTLVVHRTGNLMVSLEHARFLAEEIPNATLVELSGNDWMPYFGQPEAILTEIRGFVTGRRSGPSADRVLATVLFTDIVGSTERLAELGDRRWRELLVSHRSAVRRELEEFRGREIDTAGDGFLATFDGPGRAIRCAQAVRDSARATGIEIRAGVHTGEIELLGQGVAGLAVHIGARVMTLAGPSEVIVSSTVKDLVVGSGIQFEYRGTYELKGVPGQWRIFAVSE